MGKILRSVSRPMSVEAVVGSPELGSWCVVVEPLVREFELPRSTTLAKFNLGRLNRRSFIWISHKVISCNVWMLLLVFARKKSIPSSTRIFWTTSTRLEELNLTRPRNARSTLRYSGLFFSAWMISAKKWVFTRICLPTHVPAHSWRDVRDPIHGSSLDNVIR